MRPTTATIDLQAILNNYRVATRLAPNSGNIAVVKANAYGHGAVAVAKKLDDHVPAFGVAMFEEAVQLTDAGITSPILILQGPAHASELDEISQKGFWIVVHNQRQLDWVLTSRCSKPLQVWLKVDTGMNRLGFPMAAATDAYGQLAASEQVAAEIVLCTHLACADEADNSMTSTQLTAIRQIMPGQNLALSIANSAGVLFWPHSHAQWNRPGYMLYGGRLRPGSAPPEQQLVPAMTLSSEIIAIREVPAGQSVGYGQQWTAAKRSIIGTVAIGYGDGYPRHAANGTPVLVNGCRVPLVGRVSMDSIAIDLSDIGGAAIGDQVELWGRNLGVGEVAEFARTSGYELLTGLAARVRVVYG